MMDPFIDSVNEPCSVCGDTSTGTHYGVLSCNGCKGFFRRTVLRNQKFTCRFSKQCVIDKNYRCACRYCRFQKCLLVGMKKEAIQFERDCIGSSAKKRRSESSAINYEFATPQQEQQVQLEEATGEIPMQSPSRVIDILMEMEGRVNQEMAIRYRSSVITNASNVFSLSDAVRSPSQLITTNPTAGNCSGFVQPPRPCTVEELNEISRTTLLLMVDWAKSFEIFADLSLEDKTILLKNYAPQHLILIPAFRSPDTTRVCLFNNTYMSRNPENVPDVNGFAAFKNSNITPRVLDEIVWPMRQMNMREQEFVALKALAFLHPEAKGLAASTQSVVREARNGILKGLYHSITTHFPQEAPTRFGNILLLAPALKALTQLLIENMTLTKFFGLAEVDSLLSEFILEDSEHTVGPIALHLNDPPQINNGNIPTTSSTDINSTGIPGSDNQCVMTIL